MAFRSFAIRTFGCQMNVHDSDKLANLLLHAGYAAAEPDDADVLVVNTCSIREKAEHKLYSDLGLLRRWKAAREGRLIGVGGCVAQQEGDALLARFPQLDFVFGTHNLRHVPAMVRAAEAGQRSADVSTSRSLDRFDLPERHPQFEASTPGRAFLTVMEGCDMFCTFCIVPTTRGREVSRPADAIVCEAEDLAARGVVELVLLGQTVNAYGRHDVRRGHASSNGTMRFSALLARLAAIPGIERIRYTSPHPLFFDEALVAAHGDLAPLCPHVHLPVQSGSDAVLARMRRRYTGDDVRRLAESLRRARPGLVLTTDLIVGFPGETDAEFEATLRLVRDAGFVDAFSFKYSPRPGTPAAGLPDAVAEEVAQARLEALQAQVRAQTLAYHRSRVGGEADVLIEGRSRRAQQLAGRDPWHRVVNVAAEHFPDVAPGQIVRVRIAEATPHSLIGEPDASAGAHPGSRNLPVASVPESGFASGAVAIRR
ncbi:MAG: tRNA (N6-isopentenyl adenosine(37)-C2)-methylthiotransferase MiaB [Proteobacteria bacterium]|nr:MAG: tRNA (N6-isopentenyl adenosine(37)-C2)-methylthiotransferase MiaB [Pseudomonadota bacterium]